MPETSLPRPIACNALKAATDKLFSLAALVLLSPLLLGIALLIKLEGILRPESRGPVFFKQPRISEGRVFTIFKFRIVKGYILDEEPYKHRRDRMKTLEQNRYCTFTGKLIKKWYLDELPQLLNILRGASDPN